MKLRSMISWALVFSFIFLLFQPLIQAKEIEDYNIRIQLARINSRQERIHNDLVKYKNDTKKAQSKGLINKAKAEEELMLVPEEDLPDAEASDAATDASSTDDSATDNSDSTAATDNTDDFEDPLANVDRSKMAETFFGINTPEKAIIGDYIQISVVAVIRDDVDLKIDKINLLISDPKTKKEYFKDSFINYKDQTKILFTYNWDTIEAQTNPGKHEIIAEFYKKNSDNKPELIKRVAGSIQIDTDPGIDIMKHGFWGGYLKQDGSLNEYWQGKLGCKSGEECKTRAQIRDHLASAIKNGDFSADESGKDVVNAKFNHGDQVELNNSFTRYTHYLEMNPPKDEKSKIEVSSYALTMTDLNNFIQEDVNTKLGISTPQFSEYTATAPELHTAIKVFSEYSVKIASYAPESLDELKQAPFWPEMEKKISESISKDPDDQINSIEELNPDYKASVSTSDSTSDSASDNTSRLLPKRASAVAPLVVAGVIIGIAFCVWDIYQITKNPKDWKNWGMLALDILLLPIGGASLAEKILVHVGSWLGRVLRIGRAIEWLGAWWKTTRVCQWLGRLWEGVKGWKIWKSPIMQAIIKGVGEWASEGWKALSGAFKKAFAWIGNILRWGIYLLVRSWWKDTACPKLGLGKGLDPFAWALCSILKFFYDLGASIFRYSMCLLEQTIGVAPKQKKCEFQFGG